MSFKVYISGSSSSAEEWKQAIEAPVSELPKLSDEQKETAKRFQVAEEEYARGVLAGDLASQRHSQRGQVLGETVEKLLSGLGSGYRVDAILRHGVEFRWMLRIETPGGFRNVDIPLDLADDVIDSGATNVIEQLKSRVLQGIGRSEVARK